MLEYSKNSGQKSVYQQLLAYCRPCTAFILFATLGLLVYAVADFIFLKYFLKELTDLGLINRDPHFLSLAPWYLIGLFLCRGLGAFATTHFMTLTGKQIARNLKSKLLIKSLELSSIQLERLGRDKIFSSLNYDCEQVALAITSAVSDVVRGSCICISLIAVMFFTSSYITLWLLVFMPVLAIYYYQTSLKMRHFSQQIQDNFANFSKLANELLRCHKEIKYYHRLEQEASKIQNTATTQYESEAKLSILAASSVPMLQLLAAVAIAIILELANLEVSGLSAGAVLSIFSAMIGLLRPIKQISSVNLFLQKGLAAASNIFKLLGHIEQVEVASHAFLTAKSHSSQPIISVNNLRFKYPQQANWLLNQLSFQLFPGEILAITGPSGSGKSTLLALLLQELNLEAGSILLKQQPLGNYSHDEVLQHFAIVNQTPQLFYASIRDNILYGSPKSEVNPPELYQAARLAQALDFIQALPLGFDTMINGPDGIELSGGQKQRLILARALLKPAPILVLDEATSSLDPAPECNIYQNLQVIAQNTQQAIIIVTHNPQILSYTHKILSLDKPKQIK